MMQRRHFPTEEPQHMLHLRIEVSQLMQVVQRLSGDVPVFISAGEQPDDWEATAEEIDDRFVGDAQIW